MQLVIIS